VPDPWHQLPAPSSQLHEKKLDALAPGTLAPGTLAAAPPHPLNRIKKNYNILL